MFYEENEISDLIKCPSCASILSDPRILPCGNSMCHDCIVLQLNKAKTGLKCVICKDFHELPASGFIRNQGLANLANVKPNEVYRSKSVRDFKSDLNRILENTKTLESDLRMGQHKVREHCDFVRCDVELVAESAHQYINKYLAAFLSRIDVYEKERTENFDESIMDKENIEVFIGEVTGFRNKWISYLKNFTIDESELANAAIKGKQWIIDLEAKLKWLKSRVFKEKLLKFRENANRLESSLIGNIFYENININFESLANMNKIDIKLKDMGPILNVQLLKNENCVVVYQSKETANLNICILNKVGSVLNVKVAGVFNTIYQKKNNYGEDESCKTQPNISYEKLDIIEMDKLIFLYVQSASNFKGTNKTFRIKSFDENLTIKVDMPLDHSLNCITTFQNNLYALTSFGLLVFDTNLKKIQEIGQPKPELPFYFKPTITKIEIGKDFYFILDDSTVNFMSKSSGVIFKTFKPNSATNFNLYLDQYILLYDIRTKYISAYDFDEKLIATKLIDFHSGKARLILNANQELIFFDEKNLSIYF